MVRTMYDGITVSNLPAGAPLYAGYVDGLYANVSELRRRFPGTVVVPIAVFAHTDDGLVLDVETGDATPAQAPGWVVMRRHHGVDPTVYCNSSTWASVRAAFAAAGVPEPHYWIAQYDGNPSIPSGAIAKQYRSAAGWDASAVADYWPGVDPAQTPTSAPPAQTQEDPMDQPQYDEFKAMLWGVSNDLKSTHSGVDSMYGEFRAMLFGIDNDVNNGKVQILQAMTVQQATITTLAGLLSAQHPGVDTAAVVSAVQAAIAQAVVHVEVTDSVPPPAAAAKPAG
jgi:hypothetical protein